MQDVQESRHFQMQSFPSHHLLELWLVSVSPSDTAELNSPAASLKDANLLPSGEKTNTACIF